MQRAYCRGSYIAALSKHTQFYMNASVSQPVGRNVEQNVILHV
jgi:hypothetical protein